MELQFRCAQCDAILSAPVTKVATVMPCPSCATKVEVPEPVVSKDMVVGNFRLEDEVETSGAGRLFLATQTSMGRHVVVKLFEPGDFTEHDFSDALLQRLQILANIEHAGINRYLDSGNHQGILYIATSYVEGTCLAHHLDEAEPLDELEALDLAREIATALMEVYERHEEIHGDLKPSNIMISPEGEIRLLNFGLSLAINLSPPDDPEEGNAMIYYASPEKLRDGQHMDWRADLYSLGVILFHMLTGGVPYAADTSAEIASQHLAEAVPAVRDYDQTISHHISNLVRKMMATDPEKRHGSWREAIIDMEELLAGNRPPSVIMNHRPRVKPTRAVAASSPLDQPAKSTSPLVIALSVLALLGLIVFTVWFLTTYLQAGTPPSP